MTASYDTHPSRYRIPKLHLMPYFHLFPTIATGDSSLEDQFLHRSFLADVCECCARHIEPQKDTEKIVLITISVGLGLLTSIWHGGFKWWKPPRETGGLTTINQWSLVDISAQHQIWYPSLASSISACTGSIPQNPALDSLKPCFSTIAYEWIM